MLPPDLLVGWEVTPLPFGASILPPSAHNLGVTAPPNIFSLEPSPTTSEITSHYTIIMLQSSCSTRSLSSVTNS